VYVANTGDKDVTIKVGTLLCGYGKGRFARNKHGSSTLIATTCTTSRRAMILCSLRR